MMLEAKTHAKMPKDTITGLLMTYIKLSREKITLNVNAGRKKTNSEKNPA